MKQAPHLRSRRSGFTLVEIMIVLSMVCLLATIGIPNYLRAASSSRRNGCISNLRELDYAVQQFVLESKRAAATPIALEDCTPYLKHEAVCPSGGKCVFDSYNVTDGQTWPTCITSGGGAAHGHVMAQ